MGDAAPVDLHLAPGRREPHEVPVVRAGGPPLVDEHVAVTRRDPRLHAGVVECAEVRLDPFTHDRAAVRGHRGRDVTEDDVLGIQRCEPLGVVRVEGVDPLLQQRAHLLAHGLTLLWHSIADPSPRLRPRGGGRKDEGIRR